MGPRLDSPVMKTLPQGSVRGEEAADIISRQKIIMVL